MRTPLVQIDNYHYRAQFLILDEPVPQTNRIYPSKMVKAEILKINRQIEMGEQVLGELGSNDEIVLELGNVSHKIIKFEIVNNSVFAIIQTLPTPKGLILKTLLDQEIKLYLHFRGYGDVLPETNQVQNFQLKYIDVVHDIGYEKQKVKMQVSLDAIGDLMNLSAFGIRLNMLTDASNGTLTFEAEGDALLPGVDRISLSVTRESGRTSRSHHLITTTELRQIRNDEIVQRNKHIPPEYTLVEVPKNIPIL